MLVLETSSDSRRLPGGHVMQLVFEVSHVKQEVLHSSHEFSEPGI